MTIDQLKFAHAVGCRIQIWHLVPGATSSADGQWDDADADSAPTFECPAHLYRVHPADLHKVTQVSGGGEVSMDDLETISRALKMFEALAGLGEVATRIEVPFKRSPEEYRIRMAAANRALSNLTKLSTTQARTDTHQVIRFGVGGVGVSTGTEAGEPAVFLHEPTSPGTVGEPLPHGYEEMPLRVTLRLPTSEQAKAVADALVNVQARPEDGDWFGSVLSALGETTPLASQPSAPVVDDVAAVELRKWAERVAKQFDEMGERHDAVQLRRLAGITQQPAKAIEPEGS